MKSIITKSGKFALGLAATFFMTSCQREGCPANQFSVDFSIVEILQRTIESILF